MLQRTVDFWWPLYDDGSAFGKAFKSPYLQDYGHKYILNICVITKLTTPRHRSIFLTLRNFMPVDFDEVESIVYSCTDLGHDSRDKKG